MKKALFFATAMSVAMTSFSAFAAGPMFSFATDKEAGSFTQTLNSYGVYSEDTVDVKITAQSKFKEDADTAYASAIRKRGVSSADIDNRVILDMTGVKAEWDAYIAEAKERAAALAGYDPAAVTDEQLRDALNSFVDIDADFTLTVQIPSTMTASTADITWSEETNKCFTGRDYKLSGDTYTLAMEADKTRADNTKIVYDFFKSGEAPTVVIKGNSVQGMTTHTAKASFKGEVTISTKAGSVISRVVFPEAKSDTSVTLLSSGGGGGGNAGYVPPTPTPAATAEPTAEPTQDPTVTAEPTAEPTPIPEEDVQVDGIPSSGAMLNYNDHFAYIIGYPEGDVRPGNNITRAEVATIFFRLLTNESREKLWAQDNSFTDVNADDWFNNAVSTAANAGIVNGYEDGTFRPNEPITRAEFAAIASRFSAKVYEGADKFNDISGHWAASAINNAAEIGWINGYEDNSFKPNNKITRAEAMTLINRVTYRLVTKEGMGDKVTMKWIDNPESAWYYVNVMEATDAHDYTRDRVGAYETWTAENPALKWDNLEKADSNAGDVAVDESNLEEIPDTAPAADSEK